MQLSIATVQPAGSAMQIVNGYVCFTSCDASAARKGHDPRNPTDDPAKVSQFDGPNASTGAAGDRAGAPKGANQVAETSRAAPAPPGQGLFHDRYA